MENKKNIQEAVVAGVLVELFRRKRKYKPRRKTKRRRVVRHLMKKRRIRIPGWRNTVADMLDAMDY
jgi:hypothetical protein